MTFRKSAILILPLVVIVAFLLMRKKAPVDTQELNLADNKALFTKYCSTCHMLPAPERLTKDVWKARVLPMMAIKMGLESEDYERQVSAEEKEIEKKNNLIPEHPLISKTELDKITDYILSNAPDSITFDVKRLNRNKPLQQFTRENIPIDKMPSLITSLQFDTAGKSLWIGNYNNEVINWQWKKGVRGTMEVSSPVVHFNFYQGNVFYTEIGDLLPSELSKGSFARLASNSDVPILTPLHRPVYAEVEDLNGDNVPEILVCNFGKNTGSLSLYRKAAATGPFVEQVLMPLPGATKAYIKDMDGDGKKDIVALFAQADESVYIFYNKGNLNFEPKRVLRFPPDYGTTDMVLVDYNKDGLIDIATVHGDNADYSIILKSYHGIRLHINQGKDVFKERFFYPIYGVTKLLAEDFDKDGDVDFAASAFYPDYNALLEESFVYLENLDQKAFTFQSYTDKSDLPVKSLSLEKADIDGDGDIDILLGNFAFSPVAAPAALEEKWKAAPYGIILFKNKLR